LLRVGGKQFGPLSEEGKAALVAVVDLERLERLSERLLDASSWQELLGVP
jgi:hypothetical protein